MKRKQMLYGIIAGVIILTILAVIMLASGTKKNDITITYSLYPYLADCEYYKSVIEDEWKKTEPNVTLKYVDYNCYHDGAPEGVDVIMYDSILADEFADAGYLQPIQNKDIVDADDFFEYTINDIRKDGVLYGIPAILCSEFLIYDKNDPTASGADCIQDMRPIKDRFLVNVDENYESLYTDYLADNTGVYYPDSQDYEINETALDYVKELCNEDYYDVETSELADAYSADNCDAFLGYSEMMSSLGDRIDDTCIKTIGMTENDNIPLYFADIVGLSSEVGSDRRDKCLKLMNIISSTAVMKKAAVKNGNPSYLIFPRKSFYDEIAEEYPLYDDLYELVSDTSNRIYR